jgi:hypothetical protein
MSRVTKEIEEVSILVDNDSTLDNIGRDKVARS